jgi:hypothetical protein
MSAVLAGAKLGEFAIQVLLALPDLIRAGRDVSEIINSTSAVIARAQAENREPTPEEWDAINKVIAVLRDELHAPDAP